MTALSLHAYPHVQRHYALLPHGAGMELGYGPIVVAREPMSRDELARVRISVPGKMTTAFLVLRLYLSEFEYREAPSTAFSTRAGGRARRRSADPRGPADVRGHGLHKVVDLGEWWLLETGLPLPLGVNAARATLGEALHELSSVLEKSIRAGLDNRTERSRTPVQFGRGLNAEQRTTSSGCT